MGRLPDSFANKPITQRIPFAMSAEIVVAPSTSNQPFAEGSFLYNQDMAFEVHRMKPWIIGVSSATTATTLAIVPTQPPQDVLGALARLNIARIGGTIRWTKTGIMPVMLVKGLNEWTWELASPDTIVRQEGYEVSVQTLAMPAFDVPLTNLMIGVVFEGFQLQLGPASEQR